MNGVLFDIMNYYECVRDFFGKRKKKILVGDRFKLGNFIMCNV